MIVDNVLSNQQGTVLTNSAAVTYTGGPSTPAIAGAPITVVEPNLRVAKSASPTSVDAGDPVTYTIVVNHSSPSAEADDVSLTDQIPPGLTYVPGSLVVAAGVAPTTGPTIAAGAISAAWTSFPVGSTTTFTYDVTVGPSYNAVSSFVNTANVAWTGLPGSPPQERTGVDGPGAGLNNYAGTSTATVQPAFPTIVKTLVATSEAATTAPNATIGEILTYDLLVKIPEGSNAGFSVSDEIPAGMQFVPGSLQVFTTNGGTPATTLTSPFNGTLGAETDTGGTGDGVDVKATFGPTTNTPDGVTTNDSIVVRLQARVLDVPGNVGFGAGQTTLDNRGVVQLTGSTAVASNVVASPVVEPHLTMNKTISPNTAPQGAQVTINLAVKNDGQSNANEVVITDPLDANLNLGTLATVSTPPGFTYSLVGRTITYTATTAVIAPTDPPLNFSFTVDLVTPLAAKTLIHNVASIDAYSTLAGVVPGERNEPRVTSSADLNSVGPDLVLQKDDGRTQIAPGATTTYNLVITNVGGFQATGVSIDDTLPPGTTFVSVGGASCTAPVAPSGGVLHILVAGAIPASTGTVTCTVTITIDSPAAAGTTSYTNTAVVSDDGVNGPDPTPANNTATDKDGITGVLPNLKIAKDDGRTTLAPGNQTTYTVTVTNFGNIGMTNVLATDTLPANVSYISCSDLTGSPSIPCAQAGGVVTTTWPLIAGGATATFSVTVQVANPFPAGVAGITNTAVVTDDGANGLDPTADNTATDVDVVNALPDLAILKSHTETTVAPGGNVHYTLTVGNHGDRGATGVIVTDTLDPQMKVDCASVIPTATSCVAATGVITWGPGLPSSVFTTHAPFTTGPFVAGVTTTLTYTVKAVNPVAAATVNFTNNVSVDDDHTNGRDPTPDNNATDVVPLAGNAPALAITKTDGVTSVVPGATPTYTIVVTNSGNIAATGVVITDTLPTDLTFVSCTATCDSTTAPIITWTIPVVAGGGGTATVLVTAKVNSPARAGVTTITNPVTVVDDHANGAEVDLTDNSASDTDRLDAAPDLVVTKDDGATSRTAGETFAYTITVTNVGNQAAAGITVLDTLPTELTAISCPSTPVPCTIGTGVASGTLQWTVPALSGGGATITLHVTVVIDSAVGSTVNSFTNTVRADDDGSNGPDPTPANNQATDTDALVAVPDLQVTKTDGTATAQPGDTLTYQMVITNVGARAATGVSATDTLPPGVTFVSCSPTCNSTALPTLTWANLTETVAGSPPDPLAFDAGGQTTLTVVVTVDSPARAGLNTLDNMVVVADDGSHGADPTPTSNTAHDVDVVNAAPDLAVIKSDGVPTAVGGQTLTYTVQFQNNGNQDATGVAVTDTLPAGVTFVSCSNTCDSTNAPVIVWNVGNLGAGQAASYQLVVTVNSPVPVTTLHFVNNVAIADDGTNGPDPTPADNHASDDDTTGIDLAVTKTDGRTTAVPGAPISYTIVVTNNGPTTIQTFDLNDTVPAALLGVSYTPSSGTYDPASHTWSGFGNFAAGQSLTLVVSGTVDSAATGTLTNTVVVAPPGSIPDIDLTNNSATDVDTLTPQAVLTIVKALTTGLVHGEQAAYSITVHNNGPSIAPGVHVVDALPSSLTFVSAAGTGWTCSATSIQNVACDATGAFAANETRTIQVIVTVVGGFGENIVNGATVSALNINQVSGTLAAQATGTVADAPAVGPAPEPIGPPVAQPPGTTEMPTPIPPPALPLPQTGVRADLPVYWGAAATLSGLLLVIAVRRRRRLTPR